MSINTDNDGISPKYLGNGITKTFAFDFRVFAQTEVSAQKTSALGTITTLVYGTDYTVSLNANQDNNPGGSITTTVAPIVGESLVIISKVSYTQLTTLTTQGNFDPVVLNSVHDKAVVLAQQLRGKTDLAIRFPEADGAGLNPVLPSAIVRAKKAVVFDTAGNIGVSTDDFEDQVSTVQALVSQAQASATNSATSATSATNSATSATNSATSATNSANQALSSSVSASSSATQAQAYANSLQWSGTIDVSSNLTLGSSHSGKMLVCDTIAGNIVLTLPEISTLTLPLVIGVKKRTGDANTVTINRSGTNTIDNITSKIISIQGASVSLIPNLSGDWAVIDASLPSSGGGQQSIYFCGTTTTSFESPHYTWNVTNSQITSLYDGLTIQIKIDQNTNYPRYLKINNLESVDVRLVNSNNFLSEVIKFFSTDTIYTLSLSISSGGSKTWKVDASFCAGAKSLKMLTFSLFSDYFSSTGSISGVIPAFGGIMNVSGFSGNVTGLQTSGVDSGAKITLFFSASGTLVHSSTFQLPLSQNLTVQSGDWIVFRYFSNAWRWESYSRADGQSLLQSYEAGQTSFFAMSTAPLGYLKANGAAVSRTVYARLFSAIGTTWGAGDGSTTFNIPDLRGVFPRGWDDGRGLDAGRIFASYQADDFASHTHFVQGNGGGATSSGLVGNTGGGPIGGVTSNATGGTETRPKNVALLPCIKY